MISVSTNPIPCRFSSSEEFIEYFGNAMSYLDLFNGKSTSNLDVDVETGDIQFILKRVAWFRVRLGKVEKNAVQLDSTKESEFGSALRFQFDPQNNSISIHMETDTNVFMELFLEKRIKNFVAHIADQLN